MPLSTVEPFIRLTHISKRFPGVVAVDDVNLDIYPGEVHVIAGENGAGKSTLMKLLSQVERPSHGTILMRGQQVQFINPHYAQSLGIAMVHQEFALAPHLTVAQNISVGREPGRAGVIDTSRELEQACQLLQHVGLNIKPGKLVSTLSVAEQQLVEIAKTLAIDVKLVIMDEPTATLTGKEIDDLFTVIHDLTARGIAVLHISHRLDEMFRISDRVTIIRDRNVVATLPRGDIDEFKLIRLLVWDIANLYPKPASTIGEVIFRVQGISRRHVLHDCSFEIRSGEILGFAGLIGAGRTELARAVFGADTIDARTLWLDGKVIQVRSPADAIAAGIGYLTEDRKRAGLAMSLDVAQNITLANLPTTTSLIDLKKERCIAKRNRLLLKIRTPSIQRKVALLSGGINRKLLLHVAGAVKAGGLKSKVKVVGWDASTTTIAALQNGIISNLVLQNPFKMGYDSVKVMVNQLRNNVKATTEDTGVTFISPSNISSSQIRAALTPTCANQSS